MGDSISKAFTLLNTFTVSVKEERELQTVRGLVKVCDTVRQLVDKKGKVLLQQVVRTEYSTEGDWLTRTQAEELYNWQVGGFNGPPPQWAIEPL